MKKKQIQKEIDEIKYLRFNKLWTYEHIAKKYGRSIYWVHTRLSNYKSSYKLKCQKCDNTKRIGFHHIDRNKNNNNPKNLIPLCWKCHKRIERLTLEWFEDWKDKTPPVSCSEWKIKNLHKLVWGLKLNKKNKNLVYKDSESYLKFEKPKRLTKNSWMYKTLFNK
ncbi:MAG: hypothetical protein NT120_02775 [Candidatus Aenigmarchaeota archaeon]|nr:hypothetical protein [Candidatus Aenigmarchaeota archaeon]